MPTVFWRYACILPKIKLGSNGEMNPCILPKNACEKIRADKNHLHAIPGFKKCRACEKNREAKRPLRDVHKKT
jgi:hypothetical protein